MISMLDKHIQIWIAVVQVHDSSTLIKQQIVDKMEQAMKNSSSSITFKNMYDGSNVPTFTTEWISSSTQTLDYLNCINTFIDSNRLINDHVKFISVYKSIPSVFQSKEV